MNGLQEIRESALKCAKCGDCQTVCPIYRETKKEGSVARGRLAVLRYAAEGEIPFDGDVKENIYECLMCGSCGANCTSEVPVTDIIYRAKEIFAWEKVPFMQQFIFNHFLPHPGRLKMSHSLLRFFQDSGLRSLLKKSGFLNLLGSLAKGEDFIPQIASTFRDQEKDLLPNPQVPVIKIGYFLGCATNLLRPNQGMAAVNILRKAGFRVEIPETICCGLPVLTYGQTDLARELARKNIDILLEKDYLYLVSDCVSCSSQLKDYVNLLDKYDPYYEKAKELAGKVLDFAQVLLKITNWKVLINEKHVYENQSVCYHVPCHMARGLKAKEEVLEVLKFIKDIKYVELAEADTCCGAAGSYLATHPDLSLAVLKRKMENIQSAGADIIVTSCPECVLQLERGARIFKVPVKVMHLAELI